MYVVIYFSNGERQEGLVLAADRHRMRIAFRNSQDVVELLKTGRVWRAEDGRFAEFESVIYDAGLSRFPSDWSVLASVFQAA